MSSSLSLSAGTAAHRQILRQQILTLGAGKPNRLAFEKLALAVFQYQAVYNPIYAAYLHHLNIRPEQVTNLSQIPFMPISFFKKHTVLTGIDTNNPNVLTFASSGTTGRSAGPDQPNSEQPSRHFVPDPTLYNAISAQIFEQTYGPLRNVHILALLPSYLERNNSSLVYMVQQFMVRSRGPQTDLNQSGESTAPVEVRPGHAWLSDRPGESTPGFFLHNYAELTERLRELAQQADQKRVLLIGVTFGLLDWVESGQDLSFLKQLTNLIVMETGGMKGRRKEFLREEVHEILIGRLGVGTIHSEYGMTELLSQAYSSGQGVFRPSSTLRILLRDINDPFFIYPDTHTRTGGINAIDLANLDSCAFIETQDLGQYSGDDGAFRVLGRFDNSDIRGCNLMLD